MKKLLYFFFGFYSCFSLGMESNQSQIAMSHLPRVPLNYLNHYGSVMISRFNYDHMADFMIQSSKTIVDTVLYFKQHPHHSCQAFLGSLKTTKELLYLPLKQEDLFSPEKMADTWTKVAYSMFIDEVKKTLINNISRWNHIILVNNMVSYQHTAILNEHQDAALKIKNIEFIPIKYRTSPILSDLIYIHLKENERVDLLHPNGKLTDVSLQSDKTIADNLEKNTKIILQIFKKNKYAIINIDSLCDTVPLQLTTAQLEYLPLNMSQYKKILILHKNKFYEVIRIIEPFNQKKQHQLNSIERDLGFCDVLYKTKENKKNLKILRKKNGMTTETLSKEENGTQNSQITKSQRLTDLLKEEKIAVEKAESSRLEAEKLVAEARQATDLAVKATKKVEQARSETEKLAIEKAKQAKIREEKLTAQTTAEMLKTTEKAEQARLKEEKLAAEELQAKNLAEIARKKAEHAKLETERLIPEALKITNLATELKKELRDTPEQIQQFNKKKVFAFTIAGITLIALIYYFNNYFSNIFPGDNHTII